MPLYKYEATDTGGAKKTGVVDARSSELAVSLLKTQGLFVINLRERKEGLLDSILSIGGIPEGEVVTFTRQFSTMISAGLPLARALDVLANQTTRKGFRKVLLDVLRDVEGGSSLANAFGRYPNVFSPTYRALVKAGEASGKLDEILKRLATTMESQRELNSKFKSAMVYPTIVVFAMIGVFVMMMIFVIPKLADMYESLDVELPFMTQMMISFSDFFVKYFIFIVIGSVGVGVAVRSFLVSDEGKNLTSNIMFHAPVFGKINRSKEITDFTRTLSLLMSSAIPIVDALRIISEVMHNRAYRNASLEAAAMVEKGNNLSDYIKSNKIFPTLLGQMASVGEETGQLDDVLERVAVYFEGEVDHMVRGLSAALEPIILIMLGGMVGFLIISIITPIYKITSAI